MAPSRRRDAFIDKLNQGEELTGSTVIKKSSVGLIPLVGIALVVLSAVGCIIGVFFR